MDGLATINGRLVSQPADINDYWAERRDHDLYRLTVAAASAMFSDAKSAIDVGCYTSGLICELDWIERRIANDLQAHLADAWAHVPGVEFMPGDAVDLEFDAPFDLVISNQTVEHVDDPPRFIESLLDLGTGLIVSTTFEVPAGTVEGHVQDPISFRKFTGWFPCELDAWFVCRHPTSPVLKHILGVVKRSHPRRLASGATESRARSNFVRPSNQRADRSQDRATRQRDTPTPRVESTSSDKTEGYSRHPTKDHAFRKLRELGVPVGTVLDVGVQRCTPALLRSYRTQHHVLIEPVKEFEPRIREIYGGAGLSHEVITAAMSDEAGATALETSTVRQGEAISHARIVSNPSEGTSYRTVPMLRLDDVVHERSLQRPYLLKIDVDGAELSVLRGATATLPNCSVVVIEAGVRTWLERCNAVAGAGFELFDIVDLCYYEDRFVGADVVFLNEGTIDECGLQLYRDGFDIRHWVTYRGGDQA